MPRRDATKSALLDHIVTSADVKAFRSKLIAEATAQREWEIIHHDATFKVLFSCIGQVPMAQAADGVYALHSFLGKTGGLAGLIGQPSEGRLCFRAAAEEVLPDDARATTAWIFSDSPGPLAGCDDLFVNLKGVAEDALHLVFRV